VAGATGGAQDRLLVQRLDGRDVDDLGVDPLGRELARGFEGVPQGAAGGEGEGAAKEKANE